MKSNVCVINGSEDNMKQVLAEVEKAASYNQLEKKKTLQLMLLAEELIGIQKGILGFVKGTFYMENTGDEYKLCLHADIHTDVLTQERFIEMSSDHSNAAAKGIIPKIKYVVNYLLSGEGATLPDYGLFTSQDGLSCYAPSTQYSNVWSLDAYREGITEGTEVWDEMERSVVGKIADDVIVGTTANYVELTAVKKFE